ncbi:MAG: branched-chain amino acid ABC transporter permease [Firmicutes bacterium]|nr:branched-chain amino acid ABC transporter permease [Bacillota bacterium]
MKKTRTKGLSPYKKNEFISYGIAILGFAVITLLKSTGMLSSSLQGQLVPICAYIIMAVSLNLVVGISGELSLGHAGFMSVGAYTGILVSGILGTVGVADPLRFAAAVIAGALMAGLAGFLIGIPVLRLRGDYLAIVTLAFGEIIKNIMNIVYAGIDENGFHISTKSDYGLSPDGRMLLNGPMGATQVDRISTFLYGFILVMVTLLVVQNILNSRQGRAIMACRDNRIAAESIGLNVMKNKLMAFTVSSALAGMGGVLFGLNYSTLLPIKFNFNTSILILVFVVLGGLGNIWGSMVAAIVLTVLPEALRQFADYRMLVYAVVLIVVMIATYNPAIRSRVSAFSEKYLRRKKPAPKPAEGGAD